MFDVKFAPHGCRSLFFFFSCSILFNGMAPFNFSLDQLILLPGLRTFYPVDQSFDADIFHLAYPGNFLTPWAE